MLSAVWLLQTAKLLNSGSLNRCACNNLVYQQLCQEVSWALRSGQAARCCVGGVS